MIDKRFYYEFENRHRGSLEQIHRRLEAYSPILKLLEDDNLERNAIDYGCGRGEWLRLLTQRSWSALGVDSNDDMLSPAHSDGLIVEIGDCLSHISHQPDNSVTLITGFHIVEHLPPEILHEFVRHAYRVVRPGGLVIFETPNPENVLVGSNRFYSDPTHIHPLPPKYLEFVVEFYGFRETLSLGLNQPMLRYQKGAAAAFLELVEIFPDYAVIGRKESDVDPSGALREFVRGEFPNSSPYSYRAIDAFIDRTSENEALLATLTKKVEELKDICESTETEIARLKQKSGFLRGLKQKILAGFR